MSKENSLFSRSGSITLAAQNFTNDITRTEHKNKCYTNLRIEILELCAPHTGVVKSFSAVILLFKKTTTTRTYQLETACSII